MTTLAEIEAAALALPPDDRLALGRRLMEGAVDGPNTPPPPGILSDDAEGVREAEARLEAYRRGETAAYSLEETRSHLRELAERRAAGQSREEIDAWIASRPAATHFYAGALRETADA